jgi:hypothetical protein
MPRYFFHVHTAEGITRDETGQVLSDVDAARDSALKAVRNLSGKAATAVAGQSMLIEIVDEAGQTLLNVPLPAGATTPTDTAIEDENDLA